MKNTIFYQFLGIFLANTLAPQSVGADAPSDTRPKYSEKAAASSFGFLASQPAERVTDAAAEQLRNTAPPAHAGNAPALPNFHFVHNYLLRGGEPSDLGLSQLKTLGVETIIDLRAPTEDAIAEKKEAAKLGLRYVNLPMSAKPPTPTQVDTFSALVSAASAQANPDSAAAAKEPISSHAPQSYPHSVFVHCAHGSDRTGCMVGIWRVSHDGWSYDSAYKEMRQYYFGPKYTELANAVRIRAKK